MVYPCVPDPGARLLVKPVNAGLVMQQVLIVTLSATRYRHACLRRLFALKHDGYIAHTFDRHLQLRILIDAYQFNRRAGDYQTVLFQ